MRKPACLKVYIIFSKIEDLAKDPRAKLTRHYTKDIPDVSLYEISVALKQLKNGKAPGDDGITAELLKAGGKPILKVLQRLFDSVIHQGTTPEAWHRSVVVLFFKKGDNTLLKNYRPISLLSHVYKLFSRVITNRLARRFDDFQPPEQAGFRKGFSTIDHIHTLRQDRTYNHLKGFNSVIGEMERAQKLAMRRVPGLDNIEGKGGLRLEDIFCAVSYLG
ncbi:jg25121 [Pararge aegeria aegeria]|uniref:Jg25121 protein n=1 Tax=Pararge aegeria aegeria TaxID=348720 RepID=A0A8S4RW04_9NEOP|nr:jg25121 [Pararge aegeria aegeria]